MNNQKTLKHSHLVRNAMLTGALVCELVAGLNVPSAHARHADALHGSTGGSGLASVYSGGRTTSGEAMNSGAMTAAHRTLPFGTMVKVTNKRNGRSVLVRINDRGPFVEGRILDLSMAAAKKIDLWRAGVAQIKLEVMKSPSPLDTGGRWCVQIGSLQDEDSAAALQGHLQRRYHSAKVIKFLSPVGVWWVRVRVADDDRARAEELARETQPTEGTVFLVRLD